MNIDILTCFPDFFQPFLSHSIIKCAQNRGAVNISIHNIRDYSLKKHKKVDDYPYGGGSGLVMTVEPIYNCITALKEKTTYDEIIYMSPDGDLLNQHIVNELVLKDNIMVLCGHYKGIDERVREHLITREVSIGQYVLSGGEIPACVLIDSIVRLIPGALHDSSSALNDSFQDDIIAPPVYSHPAIFNGWEVPSVLLSGDRSKIEEWERNQSEIRTQKYNEKRKKASKDII